MNINFMNNNSVCKLYDLLSGSYFDSLLLSCKEHIILYSGLDYNLTDKCINLCYNEKSFIDINNLYLSDNQVNNFEYILYRDNILLIYVINIIKYNRALAVIFLIIISELKDKIDVENSVLVNAINNLDKYMFEDIMNINDSILNLYNSIRLFDGSKDYTWKKSILQCFSDLKLDIFRKFQNRIESVEYYDLGIQIDKKYFINYFGVLVKKNIFFHKLIDDIIFNYDILDNKRSLKYIFNFYHDLCNNGFGKITKLFQSKDFEYQLDRQNIYLNVVLKPNCINNIYQLFMYKFVLKIQDIYKEINLVNINEQSSNQVAFINIFAEYIIKSKSTGNINVFTTSNYDISDKSNMDFIYDNIKLYYKNLFSDNDIIYNIMSDNVYSKVYINTINFLIDNVKHDILNYSNNNLQSFYFSDKQYFASCNYDQIKFFPLKFNKENKFNNNNFIKNILDTIFMISDEIEMVFYNLLLNIIERMNISKESEEIKYFFNKLIDLIQDSINDNVYNDGFNKLNQEYNVFLTNK